MIGPRGDPCCSYKRILRSFDDDLQERFDCPADIGRIAGRQRCNSMTLNMIWSWYAYPMRVVDYMYIRFCGRATAILRRQFLAEVCPIGPNLWGAKGCLQSVAAPRIMICLVFPRGSMASALQNKVCCVTLGTQPWSRDSETNFINLVKLVFVTWYSSHSLILLIVNIYWSVDVLQFWKMWDIDHIITGHGGL